VSRRHKELNDALHGGAKHKVFGLIPPRNEPVINGPSLARKHAPSPSCCARFTRLPSSVAVRVALAVGHARAARTPCIPPRAPSPAPAPSPRSAHSGPAPGERSSAARPPPYPPIPAGSDPPPRATPATGQQSPSHPSPATTAMKALSPGRQMAGLTALGRYFSHLLN
jgi:hypothetical protein